jgi:hypothetical protein
MLSDMPNKDAPGEVDLAMLERAIGSHTELIAITHLPMPGFPTRARTSRNGRNGQLLCDQTARVGSHRPRISGQ